MKGSVGKYTGEALKTMETVTDNKRSYALNKVYHNEKYNLYWYINQNGYLHILGIRKVIYVGKILHYAISDNLLTKDNMLKETNYYGNYKTPDEVLERIKSEV